MLPRLRVSPMKAAIWAKTRFWVPESPCWSRLPRAASASSITTPTGVRAERILRMRSRLDSVEPTHMERKFFSFTQGKPISLGEALDEEGLGAPHRAADEIAHRHRRRVAAGDGARGAAEAVLDRRHARHHREVELRLDVLQQSQPLGLDDLLLDVARPVAGQALAVGVGAVEELADLHAGHAGGQLGEAGRRQVGLRRVPLGRAHGLEVGQPLAGVGADDLDLAAWRASGRASDRARRGSRSPSR